MIDYLDVGTLKNLLPTIKFPTLLPFFQEFDIREIIEYAQRHSEHQSSAENGDGKQTKIACTK